MQSATAWDKRTRTSSTECRFPPRVRGMPQTRVALISTGGTIEKTYDDLKGVLSNEVSVLDVMLASLQLTGIEITRMRLMNKDSLEMTSGDHDLIAKTAGEMAEVHAGVVIVHGTDRLAVTGERLVATQGAPRVPVILTGAMQPYVMKNTPGRFRPGPLKARTVPKTEMSMERRLLLAMVLAVGVLVIWQLIFPPVRPVPQPDGGGPSAGMDKQEDESPLPATGGSGQGMPESMALTPPGADGEAVGSPL